MSGRINSLRFRLREPPGPCSICSFSSEPSAELLGSTPPFRICRVCVAENLAHVGPSVDVAALEPKHDEAGRLLVCSCCGVQGDSSRPLVSGVAAMICGRCLRDASSVWAGAEP